MLKSTFLHIELGFKLFVLTDNFIILPSQVDLNVMKGIEDGERLEWFFQLLA